MELRPGLILALELLGSYASHSLAWAPAPPLSPSALHPLNLPQTRMISNPALSRSALSPSALSPTPLCPRHSAPRPLGRPARPQSSALRMSYLEGLEAKPHSHSATQHCSIAASAPHAVSHSSAQPWAAAYGAGRAEGRVVGGCEVEGFEQKAFPIATAAQHLLANTVSPQVQHYSADAEGNYNVRAGDFLADRYEIFEVVGKGTFATVVHCWDHIQRKHVAVKIIKRLDQYRGFAMSEISVLMDIERRDAQHTSGCLHMLQTFEHQGHICMVFPLDGMNMGTFLEENSMRGFSLHEVQSFAWQLLKTVAFLHEGKLTHTDLKPDNILFVDSDWEYHKHPEHGKTRVVKKKDIVLIDLGGATYEDEYHARYVSTRQYSAPEVVLEMGWSYPMDLWGVGCILMELFTGEILFKAQTSMDHLAMIEKVLGRLPDHMTTLSHLGVVGDHYRPSGELKWPPTGDQEPISPVALGNLARLRPLKEYFNMNDNTQSTFYDLLRRLLACDPHQRITASEALLHPFFQLQIDPLFDESTLLRYPEARIPEQPVPGVIPASRYDKTPVPSLWLSAK